MAKDITPQEKAAADAAFRFLSLYSPSPSWTIAVGKKLVQIHKTIEGYKTLARAILNPAGCFVSIADMRHVAIETNERALNRFPAKTMARVRYGGMTALLWRFERPIIDASRGAQLSELAIRSLGGQTLGDRFPLPGSIRYGFTVEVDENIKKSPTLTRPTLFIVEDDEDEISTNVKDPKVIEQAREIVKAMASFGVQAKVLSAHRGPILTRFELKPEEGVKAAKIVSLASDLSIKLKGGAARVMIDKDSGSVSIETRNETTNTVTLDYVLKSKEFKESEAEIPIALGVSTAGKPVVADLADMPHCLMGGATKSGKSVGLVSWILSMAHALPPERLGFILIDLKFVELSIFEGIPYLIRPVIDNREEAVIVLNEAIETMKKRYRMLKEAKVRKIEDYNKKAKTLLPYIVIVVDEMAFVMSGKQKDAIEAALDNLAAVARASGIHLILATQRPEVKVIPGAIKANLPARVAYAMSTQVDSRTILDDTSADASTLFGAGDMLYRDPGGKIERIQGCFVSDEEVEAMIEELRNRKSHEYDFGGEEEGGGRRPSSLSAAVVKTPKERVRDALSSGVTLSTVDLADAADVTRFQLYRMELSGMLATSTLDGGRTGWTLAE